MVTGGDAANAAVCDANTNDDEGNASSSSLSSLVKGETALSSTKDSEEWLELPEAFTPSKMDVIVGWARQNYHHGMLVLFSSSVLFSCSVLFCSRRSLSLFVSFESNRYNLLQRFSWIQLMSHPIPLSNLFHIYLMTLVRKQRGTRCCETW